MSDEAIKQPIKDKDVSLTSYQIYCDMDGVLVDFDSAIKKVTGGKLWDEAVRDLGLEELWRLINLGGSAWWAELNWSKDGQKLWDFLRDKNPIILTAGAISRTGDRALNGKKSWCLKHLGPKPEVIVADHGTDKKFWSEPGHILIDDLEENIRAWRSRGGIGIHHKDAAQTISELKEHILTFAPNDELEEDWRSLAAAGLLGLSTVKGMAGHKAQIPHSPQSGKPAITQAAYKVNPMNASSPEQVLMSYEIISDRSLLKMYESLNASSVSASGKLFRKVDKGTLKDPFQEGKFFMTPDLRLISVQDHEPAAAEILDGEYDSDDSWMDRWSAQLAEAGWVRVLRDGESLVFSWKASPSQIRELKNLAIENQLILIDVVNSKDRVLWQPGMDEGTDQKNSKKLQIYCDMDGVLIDFDTPLKKLTGGLLWNDAVKKYGLEELWRRINAGGVEWWSDLSWAQDGHQLWNFIKDKNPIILTAGATSMTGDRAERGKKIWCARELGNSFEVIVADHGKDKKYWAAPNHILIDDLEENIRAWRSRGGIGILHRNATQTIAELKDHLLSWSDDPDALEEDWRSLAAAGLIGAASLTGAHGASAKHHSVPHNKAHITHTISNKMTPLTATTPEQLLIGYENSKDNPNGGYDKASGKWFPARSLEGGSDTIAYGHKIQPDEDFSAGLTDSEALNLLKKDIAIREASIRMNLPSYDTLPQYVKNAILSAWYRGDLGPRATPKTWALITSGNWSHVANEYLNSKDFRSGLSGVKKRMQDNADAFTKFASEKV